MLLQDIKGGESGAAFLLVNEYLNLIGKQLVDTDIPSLG